MPSTQLHLPLTFETRSLLRCSMPRPRNPVHHLTRDAKGWRMAITVQGVDKSGRVVTSKRLRWRLGRIPEREALIRRDAAIAAYRKIGLRVESRQLVRGLTIDGERGRGRSDQ